MVLGSATMCAGRFPQPPASRQTENDGHRLELLLDAVEEVGVRLGVDLATQDLLGAGHRQRGDVVAQLLARARYFLLDLRLCRCLLAVALVLRRNLRLLDHLRGALLGLRDDVRGAAARACDFLARLPGRKL